MNDIDHAAVTFIVALVGLAVHYQWGGLLIGMTIGAGATFVWSVLRELFASRAADSEPRPER